MSAPVVLAEVVRSGFVEGRHRGSVVALNPDGSVAYTAGPVDRQILPRSCNKPFQALGMLQCGLMLEPELLALACASHSAEAFQIEGVRRILSGAGIDESHLQTPPDYPYDDVERETLIRAGGRRAPILMNCSGKHAAMLATCVLNGWHLEDYRDPGHPLQQQIAQAFSDTTGEAIEHVAVDGCGAPLLSTSLTGLARGFAALATASTGPEAQIASAMRTHPEYVSGTRRDDRALTLAIPGVITKAGAEACHAMAFADGRALALKIEDGADRARPAVLAAVLARLGWDRGQGVDTEAIAEIGHTPLLGAGVPVGEIRPVLP